jgi:hypothetical protein
MYLSGIFYLAKIQYDPVALFQKNNPICFL